MKLWIGIFMILFALVIFIKDIAQYPKENRFSRSPTFYLLLGVIFFRGVYDLISYFKNS